MNRFGLQVSFVPLLLFLLASGAAGLDHQLDFDELEEGYQFRRNHQAYADLGITIGGPGFPTVVRPSVTSCSPSHALRNEPSTGSEFGSANEDLEITLADFTADRVSVSVGKDEDTSPLSLTARLEGWGTGAGGHNYLVAADEVELPAGVTGISHRLTVESDTGEITFLRITYGGFSAPELIDCLDIHVWEGSPPEPPADTTAPQVHITYPANGAEVTRQSAGGYVDDDRGIVRLTITTPLGASALPIPAPNFVDGRLRYYLAGFIDLREGINDIRLEAEDVGGNTATDRIQVTYSLPDDPLPPDEVPPDLDFVATGMEPTQVIQGWGWIGDTPADIDNRTQLISGKKTLVRVYAEAHGTPEAIPQVNAWLRGYGPGGEEFPDSPLHATSRVTLTPGETYLDQRVSPNKSFNFILPPSWTQPGSVRLEATVNYLNGIPERPGAFDLQNSVIEDVIFHDTEEMCIFAYPVLSTEEGNVAPGWGECIDNIALLRQIYPVNPAKLDVIPAGALETDYVLGTDDEDALFDFASDFRKALGLYYGSAYVAPCTNFVYLALTDATVEHRGVTTHDRPVSVSVASTDFFFRMKTAHEVGHSQGLGHIQGCRDPADPYEDYPAYTDAFGGSYFDASIGDWGVDIRDDNTFVLRDPTTDGDMMSYCGDDRWMSVYSWRWLSRHFGVAAGASAAAEPEGAVRQAKLAPYLVINGALGPGGVTLDPAWTDSLPEGSSDDTGKGSHRLRLLGSTGTVLFERRFTPEPLAELEDYATFHEVVPARPGTRGIELTGPGIVGSIVTTAGPSVPQVRVTSPNGGEQWPATGSATISWISSDTDHDALTYVVFYSHNGGKTWQVIGSALQKPSFTVALNELPGCDNRCLVRVAASDGINQGQDDSDATFSKAGRPPIVRILSPEAVAVYDAGSLIWFEAVATDREDGIIPDDQVYWLSGRDGLLGNGRTFATDSLSPGLHRIGVAAIDSDGQWAGHLSSVFIVETTPAKCLGDCNGDGVVTVDELVLGVNIALGKLPSSDCTALDRNASGTVTIDELVAAVGRAVQGCD